MSQQGYYDEVNSASEIRYLIESEDHSNDEEKALHEYVHGNAYDEVIFIDIA